MSNDHNSQPQNLKGLYDLIDEHRTDAAKVAKGKFQSDIQVAIAAIASIGSIAGARVLADSRVASANVLINAELAATRLLAEAEIHASRCAEEALSKPKEIVEAALREIGKHTTTRLIATAQESVEKIRRDAEVAITILRE